VGLEAEIARHIYEEVRDSARRNKSVRLPLRMDDCRRLWPGASKDELIRAHLIAYEMLIADVAEAISTASGAKPVSLPSAAKDRGDEEGGNS
jgi:hypothetical protein